MGRERVIAGKVIDRLQGEFLTRVELEPYFWEHEPMRATTDYQGNIPSPSEFDIVVCILWSRLGSRLNPNYRRADESPYDSGTEYELDVADRARKLCAKPEILVYRNQQQPMIPISPAEVREERVRQYDKLQTFLRRWFLNADGTVRIATNDYDSLGRFEEKLEDGLRAIIREKAPAMRGRPPGAMVRFGTYARGSPFRPLRAFEFEDAEIFFGRTGAIDGVLDAMQEQAATDCAFTLIFGGSGSGKSSLAKAGVVPMLVKPGVIEGMGLWRRAELRPGKAQEDLFGALAAALLGETALPELTGGGVSAAEFAASLRDAPAGVPLLVKRALTAAAREIQARESLPAPPGARLVLLLDQLEELFTVAERFPPETCRRFFQAVEALARSGAVWVLATLRSEFFARCEQIPELVAMKSGKGQYQLLPPTKPELSQIIRLPAIAAGLEFEADPEKGTLDDILLDAAGKDSTVLPLLEFTLDELFKRRRDDLVLTHAAFQEIGGIGGALKTAAEEVFATLPETVTAQFEPVFRGLVTIELGGEQTFARRITDSAALATTPERQRLVNAFVEGRLLVSDRDANNRPVVYVAHEALFQHWPRLKELLEKNREFLERRARAGAGFSLWKEKKSDPSYLWWHGEQLAEARALLVHAEELTAREKEFTQASIAAGVSASRNRWLVAAAVIVIIAVAGFVGFDAWKKARVKKDIELLHQQIELSTEPASDAILSRRILKLDAADSKAWASLASALLDQNDEVGFEEALRDWQKNVQPRVADIDYLLGEKEDRRGNKETAIKHWNAYLKHPKLDLTAKKATWRKLTAAYESLEQWEQARNLYNDWITSDDGLEPRALRANAHAQLRDWDNRDRDIEWLQQNHPDAAETKAIEKLADHKSIEEWNDFIRKSSRDPRGYLERAVALARERQFKPALEDIEIARKLDSESARLKIEEAHLRWQLEQQIPDDLGVVAVSQWTRDAQKFPGAFATLQRRLSSLSAIETRMSGEPQKAGSFLERGELLAHIEQHALAIQDFTTALEIDGESTAAYQLRAASHRALGEADAADADLQRATELERKTKTAP